jgi:hypothetical protein
MPSIIFVSQVPANGDQRKLLTGLFASPGLSLLKEIITSRCIKAQAEAMNAELYEGNNEKAEDIARTQRAQARLYNQVLDVLDDIGNKEDEWFTVKLEPRR